MCQMSEGNLQQTQYVMQKALVPYINNSQLEK